MPQGEFCKWTTEGGRTECLRCGSVCYDGGEPTCPPWVTRFEPDNKRLPYIKTKKQNIAARQAWLDRQEYKLPTPSVHNNP